MSPKRTHEKELIICSVGVHAMEMSEIVERINAVTLTWKLLGFFAEKSRAAALKDKELNGYPVLGTIDDLERYPDAGLVPGNEFHDPFPIEHCVSIVDPSSFVSRTAAIGRACVVYPGCYIGHKAALGDRVFMLSGCTVNHDDRIENNVVMASGVTLAGVVTVETECYLGQSCTVRQYLRIGKDSLIGMGSVVVKDVPPNSVMIGNPARSLRDKKPAHSE